MNNKFLSFLVLIWVFWAWYLYYHFKYLPWKTDRENQKIQAIIEQEAENKEVKIVKIEKDESSDLETNKYANFNLYNWKIAYFEEKESYLELFLENEKVWNFDLVYNNFLRVEYIYWSISDLYIEVWKKKYYYNSINKELRNLDFFIDVLYVKKGISNNLIFVSDKWSFKYLYNENKFDYFNLFSDYINFQDWYLWIIKSTDERILKNLWLNSNYNLVVFYNPLTKEKNIIYETDIEIKKIYFKNKKVYLEDINNEEYILENI